jgi:hypothetical protein
MFALDHTHYSRWLFVHIGDMMSSYLNFVLESFQYTKQAKSSLTVMSRITLLSRSWRSYWIDAALMQALEGGRPRYCKNGV